MVASHSLTRELPRCLSGQIPQEIKAKANDVPAVLSPTATDCEVQWKRAVSLLIRELSFLTPDLAARPG